MTKRNSVLRPVSGMYEFDPPKYQWLETDDSTSAGRYVRLRGLYYKETRDQVVALLEREPLGG